LCRTKKAGGDKPFNYEKTGGLKPSATTYFFSSSPTDPTSDLILLTEFDWHLGQARSTKGPLGSKGILNSCPQRKHLNLVSSGIGIQFKSLSIFVGEPLVGSRHTRGDKLLPYALYPRSRDTNNGHVFFFSFFFFQSSFFYAVLTATFTFFVPFGLRSDRAFLVNSISSLVTIFLISSIHLITLANF